MRFDSGAFKDFGTTLEKNRVEDDRMSVLKKPVEKFAGRFRFVGRGVARFVRQ